MKVKIPQASLGELTEAWGATGISSALGAQSLKHHFCSFCFILFATYGSGEKKTGKKQKTVLPKVSF